MRSILLLSVSVLVLASVFECEARGNETPADEELTRAGFLLQRADTLTIQRVNDDGTVDLAKRVSEPVLKYTNPLYEAQSDGVLLVWTIDSVPVTFASYSIRHEKRVFKELAVCSETALQCKRDGNAVWMPKPVIKRTVFDTELPVPANERLRLRTMKRLAQQFQSGKKRVLTTPLYRYESEKSGVIDGAVFTLSDTNDPEILVIIEAFESPNQDSKGWRYTLARMNSQPQQVYLNGTLLWDLKGYWKNPRSRTDPYLEALDADLPEQLKLGN